jgi:protein TonB
MTVGLSCLLHLGFAMALVLGQHWVPVAIAVRPPVMPVHLVTLDTVEEPKIVPPAPQPSPPPHIRPPRVLETPKPREAPPIVKAHEPAPPPPAPVAPTPSIDPAPPARIPEPAPEPSISEAAAPGPPVTTFAPAPPTNGTPAPVAPSAATATRTAMAVPPGVTQFARPQGGYQVRPSYPAAPRRLGIQGTTLLRVHVLADGRIGEVLVEKSGGHPDLDQAATDAVRAWRFDPARRGTEPVAMWVLLPVEFRLK